jgi:hypothetical protein
MPRPARLRCAISAPGINWSASAAHSASYRLFKPPYLLPTAQPTLIAAKREDVEMWSRAWKGNRYDWGLIQEMTQNSARD